MPSKKGPPPMQNSVGQEPKNVKKNDFWTDSARIALHAMQRKTSVPSRRKQKLLHDGILHNWVRQETAKLHIPSSSLKTRQNRKTSKNEKAEKAPPLAPKTRRSRRAILEKTCDLTAAQVPRGSMDTSVASRPHSPRPKDCSGLGDPNTLKL